MDGLDRFDPLLKFGNELLVPLELGIDCGCCLGGGCLRCLGALCGGSGIALISSGPAGILAGTAVSLMLLALGKEKMESALLDANLPRPMRHLVSERSMRSRKEEIADQVKARLYKSLEREKNDEITARMTEEISQQIETCLTRMAEVVEIPLDF